MKTLFAFFIFSLLAFSSKAQWVELDPGIEVPYFSDVYAITSETVIVVGANGTILKTTDGGETWEQKPSGTTSGLSKVQFPTSEVGYVIGNSGTFLKTIDGGETWEVIDTGYSSNFEGLSCVNENIVFITYFNNIIRSVDSGNNWNNYQTNSFYSNYVQFFDSQRGYTVSTDSNLQKTEDGGETWQELTGFSPIYYFIDENIGFYYYYGLHKTIDGGNNFISLNEGDIGFLYDVFAIDENNIWGIIEPNLDGDGTTTGIINISNNGVYTETIAWDNNSQIDMSSIHFANETTGYIAGYKDGKGAIWKNGTGINVLDTNEVKRNDEIKVYPNPASKEINIEIRNKNLNHFSITLTDFAGNQVYARLFDTKKIKINTERFPKGTYILSIKTNEKNYTKKIIIN